MQQNSVSPIHHHHTEVAPTQMYGGNKPFIEKLPAKQYGTQW